MFFFLQLLYDPRTAHPQRAAVQAVRSAVLRQILTNVLALRGVQCSLFSVTLP